MFLLCCPYLRMCHAFFPSGSHLMFLFNYLLRISLLSCLCTFLIQLPHFKIFRPAFQITPARQKESHYFYSRGFQSTTSQHSSPVCVTVSAMYIHKSKLSVTASTAKVPQLDSEMTKKMWDEF